VEEVLRIIKEEFRLAMALSGKLSKFVCMLCVLHTISMHVKSVAKIHLAVINITFVFKNIGQFMPRFESNFKLPNLGTMHLQNH